MGKMRNTLIAAAAALALTTPLTAASGPAFGWLVGDWRTEGSGEWTSEHWEPMQSDTMQGSGRTGKGDQIVSTDTMRITLRKGAAIYIASPNGAPPTEFREASRGSQEIVFENPAHDYPQRVHYWRDGEALMAEISLKDGSQPMRWRYRRVK